MVISLWDGHRNFVEKKYDKNWRRVEGVWGVGTGKHAGSKRKAIGKACPGVHGTKVPVEVEAELHSFLTLAL
jgi:hypothetical protein